MVVAIPRAHGAHGAHAAGRTAADATQSVSSVDGSVSPLESTGAGPLTYAKPQSAKWTQLIWNIMGAFFVNSVPHLRRIVYEFFSKLRRTFVEYLQ